MTILVANPGLQVLARVRWRRAAVLLSTDIAFNMPGAPRIMVVHSQRLTMPIHKVVIIKRDAYRPWHNQTSDDSAPKHYILARDNCECAYCGEVAETVDHILPQCRNGPSTWGNQVAACHECNCRKADRTPNEAGMPLRYAPYVYDPWAEDQKEVHALFTLTAEQEDPP